MIDSLSFAGGREITANWVSRSIFRLDPKDDQMIFRHLARCVYLSSLKRVSSSIRFARIIFTRLPVGPLLLLAFQAWRTGSFRVSSNLEERKFLSDWEMFFFLFEARVGRKRSTIVIEQRQSSRSDWSSMNRVPFVFVNLKSIRFA